MFLQESGSKPIRVACKECIYGHRAPTCTHINKVLVEVRAPGRPRMHCVHGLDHDGKDRCRECFPAVAFVVPGHRGKLGKCSCHSNPKEPIRDAQRAPQDVAEAHEDDRERAKEMRKLRQSRGSLPEEPDLRASKRNYSETTSTIKSEEGGCPCDPGELLGGASKSSQSKSISCCQTGHDSVGRGSPERKRRKEIPIRPWPNVTEPLVDPTQASDRCACLPGACTCLGCADHPRNLPTMNLVRELWGHQLQEQQQPEVTTTEPVGSIQNTSQQTLMAPPGQAFQNIPTAFHTSREQEQQPSTAQLPNFSHLSVSIPSTRRRSGSLGSPPDVPHYVREAHNFIQSYRAGTLSLPHLATPMSEIPLFLPEEAPSTQGSSGSIGPHTSMPQHAPPVPPQVTPQELQPPLLTTEPQQSPLTEYTPFDFDYQVYTVMNSCMNQNCWCGIGCTCEGCCSHVGHREPIAANLLMEDTGRVSSGVNSPVEQGPGPSSNFPTSNVMSPHVEPPNPAAPVSSPYATSELTIQSDSTFPAPGEDHGAYPRYPPMENTPTVTSERPRSSLGQSQPHSQQLSLPG